MPVFNTLGFDPAFTCRAVLPSPGCKKFVDLRVGGSAQPGVFAVRVDPRGALPWCATFAGLSEAYLTGMFAHPCETTLVVVSGGAAYLVPVLSPDSYRMIGGAVRGVARVPGRALIVLWDDQNLFACDRHGTVWCVVRLAEDDLQIDEVTAEAVVGTVPDYGSDTRVSFRVDVMTGSVSGGWIPPRVERRV